MKGGEVSSAIDSLSQQIHDAGKTAKLFNDTWDLALQCRTDDKGTSPCYGAVVFLSSPSEGTNLSSPGNWNYTIRNTGAITDDIRTVAGPEKDLLPLQFAVDSELISRSNSANKTQLPADLQVIAYSNMDQSALSDTRTATYLDLSVYIFGPLFAFTMVEIVYHMTSFVSRERELGT